MKLLVLSDLHIEFAPFVPDPEAVKAADVVVLAGDIHPGSRGIGWARQTFPEKPVIYVAGNHEFYGHHWDALLPELREQAKEHGVHFLENDAVTIDGIRFLGTTLWTDYEYFGAFRRSQMMRAAEAGLNDFRAIKVTSMKLDKNPNERKSLRLSAQHTLQRHQESLIWLKKELPLADPQKTVVVTHHYPHANSTNAKWKTNELTAIFGSKLPVEILLGAKLWVHGHTHDSCEYRIESDTRNVRIVCNPRGYPLDWQKTVFENFGFDQRLMIHI